MVLLGTPKSKGVTIPVTVPTFIPPQQMEMIDTSTGKKKLFTIDNISKLIELLGQGYKLFSQIRGGTGSQTVYVTKTDFSSKPTDGSGGGGAGGKEAGISVNSLIGYGVAAAIMLSLYMTLKDK